MRSRKSRHSEMQCGIHRFTSAHRELHIGLAYLHVRIGCTYFVSESQLSSFTSHISFKRIGIYNIQKCTQFRKKLIRLYGECAKEKPRDSFDNETISLIINLFPENSLGRNVYLRVRAVYFKSICVLSWKHVRQNISRHRDIVFVGEIIAVLFSKYTPKAIDCSIN